MNIITDNFNQMLKNLGKRFFNKKVAEVVRNEVLDFQTLEIKEQRKPTFKKRMAQIVKNEKQNQKAKIIDTTWNETKKEREVIVEAQKSGINIIVPGFGAGSGVILNEDGYILTNRHVVEVSKSGKVEIQLLDINGLNRSVEGEVFYQDGTSDVAIVKINPDDVRLMNGVKLQPINLESNKPEVGDRVITIGNAKSLGVEEKNRYGILPEALIEKRPDGKYISRASDREVLMRNILTKEEGGKYRDSNGEVFIRKNNNFYSEKNDKRIEDRDSILIKDKNDNLTDINHKKVLFTKRGEKFFIDNLEVRDVLAIQPWTDKPYTNDFYVDMTVNNGDIFTLINKNELKDVKFSSHEKDTGKINSNGEKIMEKIFHDDGSIEKDGKKYWIGNVKSNSMSAAVGSVTHESISVRKDKGNLFIESELMGYPGGSGGMTLNANGNLTGLHTRGTYSANEDKNHTKDDPKILSYAVPTETIIDVIHRAEKEKNVKIDFKVVYGKQKGKANEKSSREYANGNNLLNSDVLEKLGNIKHVSQGDLKSSDNNSKFVDKEKDKSFVDKDGSEVTRF